MDWLKEKLDKFVGFAAPLIPGAAVLVIVGIHHPDWGTTFRDITYLGYRTKVSLVVATAFVAGWTVITVYGVGAAFLEGMVGEWLSKWLLWDKPENPPWRVKNWRALAAAYLGSAAPEDLDLVPDELYKLQVEVANGLPDPQARANELVRVAQIKSKAVTADLQWESWWSTLHHDVLQEKDPVSQLSLTIEANLQAASVVLLCAIPSTPVLNRWWVISAGVFWLLMRPLRTFSMMRQIRNPWSSFTKQMDYLRSHLPSTKAKGQGSDA